jgi:TRAP-type C4-dicarboxylate transport system permease small subunit
MVFLVYLGAALASKHHSHISVTLLDEMLAKGSNKIVFKIYRTIIALISLAFLCSLIVIGMKVLPMVNAQRSPNMGIPMSVAYASIPLGGALMALYIVLEVILLYAAPTEGGKA